MDLATLEFGLLNDLFEVGQNYYDEVESMRAAEHVARKARGPKFAGKSRKCAGDALRDRQLW